MPKLSLIQPALALAARPGDGDAALRALAARSALSPFHLHRLFSAVAGETPKQYSLRLRLNRAAILLRQGSDSVLNVALNCGFRSPEVFCRAFRRRFDTTPGAWRRQGFVPGLSGAQIQRHGEVIVATGPCIGLFHYKEKEKPTRSEVKYSIEARKIDPQPALVVRRTVKPAELAGVLAEEFPKVAIYAMQAGGALAGQPITRYLECGPGLWTIEAGFPVAAPIAGAGDGHVIPETLPGGLVAVTTHAGPYDKLQEAHAALQVWIAENGFTERGARWEVYVTDPAEFPDPADWKTDVFWPIA